MNLKRVINHGVHREHGGQMMDYPSLDIQLLNSVSIIPHTPFSVVLH